MLVDIITPEDTIYSGQVESVSVPGVQGEFQMLDLHAPIVSVLTKGSIKLHNPKDEINEDKLSLLEGSTYTVQIKGGVIEMNNNKLIILAE